MLPFSIHSDTITNRCGFSSIVTPINGNTFEWESVFHITTSLQNHCTGNCKFVKMRQVEHLPPFLSPQGYLLRLPSKPSLQHTGPYAWSSTRPPAHLYTGGSPLDRSKAGFEVISEARLHCDRSDKRSAGNFFGSPLRGHPKLPKPNRQGQKL